MDEPLLLAVAVAFILLEEMSLKATVTVGGVALIRASKASSKAVILRFRLSNTAKRSQAFTTRLPQLVLLVVSMLKPLGTVLVPVKLLSVFLNATFVQLLSMLVHRSTVFK